MLKQIFAHVSFYLSAHDMSNAGHVVVRNNVNNTQSQLQGVTGIVRCRREGAAAPPTELASASWTV